MNQVSLVGNITKDPILRKSAGGSGQTTFVIAVNRNFKNSQGEVETDFILCTIWGRLAENTAKYCGKGSLIGITGRIQSRSYTREDQSRVYVTEVIGEQVRFLSTKSRTNKDLYENPTVSKDQESEHFHLPKNESEQLPIT